MEKKFIDCTENGFPTGDYPAVKYVNALHIQLCKTELFIASRLNTNHVEKNIIRYGGCSAKDKYTSSG